MNLQLAPRGEGTEEGLELAGKGKPLQGMLSVQGKPVSKERRH